MLERLLFVLFFANCLSLFSLVVAEINEEDLLDTTPPLFTFLLVVDEDFPTAE